MFPCHARNLECVVILSREVQRQIKPRVFGRVRVLRLVRRRNLEIYTPNMTGLSLGKVLFAFDLAREIALSIRLDNHVGWPRDHRKSRNDQSKLKHSMVEIFRPTDVRPGRCHSYSCTSCCHTTQELDLEPYVPFVQVFPK